MVKEFPYCFIKKIDTKIIIGTYFLSILFTRDWPATAIIGQGNLSQKPVFK